jgi:hypothetical protein
MARIQMPGISWLPKFRTPSEAGDPATTEEMHESGAVGIAVS